MTDKERKVKEIELEFNTWALNSLERLYREVETDWYPVDYSTSPPKFRTELEQMARVVSERREKLIEEIYGK